MRYPERPEDFQDYFNNTGDTAVRVEDGIPAAWQTALGGELVCFSQHGERYVTAARSYRIELETARKVIEHRDSKSRFPKVPAGRVKSLIREYEKQEGDRLNCVFRLAEYQKEAVIKAVASQVFVLTGGPGTGKTCVLKCIEFVLKSIRPDALIRFAAPTGKAARRITESTGSPASTVQKMMGLAYEGCDPYPIYADVVIVDESSMMDRDTADAFFSAVQEGAKIIIVGDVDQLPSVGCGNVLDDLISSGEIPVEKLTAPQRQKGDSCLYENITAVRNGQWQLQEGDDFHIVPADASDGQKKILGEYFRSVKKWGIENTCCLTPYRRKGSCCANVLNDIIQGIVNSPASHPHLDARIVETGDDELDHATWRNVTFVVGDPVIQLVNRAECVNGDIGKVVAADGKGVTVRFDEGDVRYCGTRELSQLNLAYCMSVHKAQGSEYKCVVTAVLPEHRGLLSRNLVYTAITRAKKECVLVADADTLREGLQKQAGSERTTLLSDLIAIQGRKAVILRRLQKIQQKMALRFYPEGHFCMP